MRQEKKPKKMKKRWLFFLFWGSVAMQKLQLSQQRNQEKNERAKGKLDHIHDSVTTTERLAGLFNQSRPCYERISTGWQELRRGSRFHGIEEYQWTNIQPEGVGIRIFGTTEGTPSWLRRLQESNRACLSWWPLASLKRIQPRQPADWSHKVVVRWRYGRSVTKWKCWWCF